MSNGPRYRGKTFHEYMSAKFWHPASKRNIVTVWKRKQQMEVCSISSSRARSFKLLITSIHLKMCSISAGFSDDFHARRSRIKRSKPRVIWRAHLK